MKKRITGIIALCLVLTALAAALTGCGASSRSDADYVMTEEAAIEAPASAVEEYYYDDTETYDYAADTTSADSGSGGISQGSQSKEVDITEKIIYSMDVNIETLDFDSSIDRVSQLLERFGGFVENSSVSGVDINAEYYGYNSYRYASYTLRIPAESFQGMTDALSEIGNVTNLSTYADNITTQYYDSQSRLNAYRTEEERLLAMLEKVEDVDSMIVIEQRLSEVRYEIESLETTLTNWQRQVDYSTVYIYIEEVARLTEEKPVTLSYGERLVNALTDSLKGVGSFFKEFLVFLLGALPVLVILAVVAVAAVIIIKKRIRKRKAAKAAKKEAEKNPQDDSVI